MKANDWISIDERLPEDGQWCWVANADAIYGKPMQYDKSNNHWIDLFASYEAGMVLDKNSGLTHWAPQEAIETPPDPE